MAGGPRKVHTVFPYDSSERERIIWLLDNIVPYRQGQTYRSVLLTNDDNAQRIKQWLEVIDIRWTARIEGQQISISFEARFRRWIEDKAKEYEFLDAPYCKKLEQVRSDIEPLRLRAEHEKRRLIELLYMRDNKRGCFDCNRSDEFLCFDHMETTLQKVSVSTLLLSCKWQKAETEAMRCQIRCIGCVRKKNAERIIDIFKKKEKTAVRSAKSEAGKKYKDRMYAQGKAREIQAKIDAKQCATCKKPCVIDNVTAFDFDHMDPSTKIERMSQLRLARDERFRTELGKCRLLCTACHSKHSGSQKISGEIRMLRKRERDITEEVVVAEEDEETVEPPLKKQRLMDVIEDHIRA